MSKQKRLIRKIKNVIEYDFMKSWDEVIQFYHDVDKLGAFIPEPDLSTRLNFIDQMRKEGYDKIFRAGQMLLVFVLSRSLQHGLRADQPFLAFEFHKGEIKVYSEKWEIKILSSKIEFTHEMKLLLKELEAHKID